MATILVSIILISGFIFVTNHLPSRYKYKRSNGWDAYFYVATWGIGFLVIGWALASLLSYWGILRWLANFASFDQQDAARLIPLTDGKELSYGMLKLAAWMVLSISIAALCGMLSRLRAKDPITRWNTISKVVSSNHLESLLIYASSAPFPIVATLSSRKVYIGIVTTPGIENGAIEYIEVLPLLSGYRNKDELTLHITTNYHDHYKRRGLLSREKTSSHRLSINDFRVIIPVSEIETLSLFDRETYNDFKAQEDHDKLACTMLGDS
ncbi:MULTISPECIES: hypothetical protein [Aeromonas]|uniref:hypothetical protein n=1 Tax=Aeromonas TaxID=642 RepID=UPI000A5ADAA3|nr:MULTISPECIES: hypothetical protein [Aeromonas]EJN6957986.1 hypothetical protein [Aeromonas hydrophila]MBL0561393.1 hypothetical protein [Aeromonas hydrophila]QWL80266.1 hypothetical protein HQ395_16640 [Aeromonas hydrophila]WAG00116.1 hypothetical protein NRZ31_04920 [Aeromonas dhakensis]CAD7534246.1 hypothetical protein KBAH04_20440 [Aeromonas hydrophila]